MIDIGNIINLCNDIENTAYEIRERTMSDSCYLADYIINKIAEVKDVLRNVNDSPAVPTYSKRGNWIELPKAWDQSENPCKCSVCGHVLSFMHDYPKSKYCPACGARMNLGSRANGCWLPCKHCANNTCPNRDEAEVLEND